MCLLEKEHSPPLNSIIFYLKSQGDIVVTNFCSQLLIQQNILNLQIIPKNPRCISSVQELDSPPNANGDSQSLRPFQYLSFPPICKIQTQTKGHWWSKNWSSKKKKQKLCSVLFALPVRWSRSDPFPTCSRTMKTVLAVWGWLWYVTIQCPRMLTKCWCLNFVTASICCVKLCGEYLCFTFRHFTKTSEPSISHPL